MTSRSKNKRNQIPKLEELSFELFFKEMVYKATHKTADFVKDCMDNQLWGRIGYNVRKSYIMKLNEIFELRFGGLSHSRSKEDDRILKMHKDISVNHTKQEKNCMDEFAPLDCILDSNFEELNINTPFLTSDSFSALFSIIARRAPKLKKLTITLQETTYKLVKTEQSIMLLCTSVRLDCLTSLSILSQTRHTTKIHQSTMRIIGERCPALTKLMVSFGFCLKKKDLLELILIGEMADILFPIDDEGWSQDSTLQGIQVPSELLNTLCFTLERLTLGCSRSNQPVECECYPFIPAATYAFILRHLPKLQAAHFKAPIEQIFKELHKTKKMDYNRQKQAKFERVCKDAITRIGLGNKKYVSPSPPSLFSGFTSMEAFPKEILISDVELVQAVGSICPQLKNVTFKIRELEDKDAPSGKLITILSTEWPKALYRVTLFPMNFKYLKAVFNIFGPNLTSLNLFWIFSSCVQIDIMECLTSCSKLERLVIIDLYSSVIPIINSESIDAASNWTSDTFLPMLTHFDSSICFGVWAVLIERKSTLINLSLKCCHIGTNAYKPRLEWSQVAELWPNMEYLYLGQCCCSGLTMTMISKIIPQFKKIWSITLPGSITAQESEQIFKVAREFAGKRKSVAMDDILITIGDNNFSLNECPFQLNNVFENLV